MNEYIDDKFVTVNQTLYIDANFVYEYLKYIFDEIKNDANEDVVSNLENKLDVILEEIEYNEWERD